MTLSRIFKNEIVETAIHEACIPLRIIIAGLCSNIEDELKKTIYSEENMEIYDKVRWCLTYSDHIHLSHQSKVYVQLSKQYPSNMNSDALALSITGQPKLENLIAELENARADLRELKFTTATTTRAVLDGADSLQALKKIWPECTRFIPSKEPQSTTSPDGCKLNKLSEPRCD